MRMAFETERLLVRPWSVSEAARCFEIYSDPRVTEFLGGSPPVSIEEQRERIRGISLRYADRPEFGLCAIVEKKSQQIVGSSLLKLLPDSNLYEVGWHLAPEYWGQGYASESGRGAIDFAFLRMGLAAVYAVVNPENTRSLRVCERLGMTCLGLTTAFYGQNLQLFTIARTLPG